ncbi:hypothetical protein JB92DRAFT_3111139 [Gautieria morchelliformis]|nr:hypothetical protein JB92DRAFT_3111139 [Gautieria morchelliformis]
MLAKGKPDGGANPQALTKFQMPNTTSPLSTDSSPSPPSANDDNASFNGSDGNSNNVNSKGASPTDEDHHKRKASADDFDDEINGQPSAKTQHTDPKSKKAIQARRKSGGGEKGQDESRLLKRKEQNRAAQRAFRERKEKHVKDLEDKVAQLEAKTESQATENENLRDMLGRLQHENVALKQSSFTFSVPPGSAPTVQNRGTSRSPSDSLNLFADSSASIAGPSRVVSNGPSPVASASTHDSPNSLFERFEGFSVPKSDAPTTSSPGSTPSVNPSASTPDADTLAFFGSPGPFTTVSSNPMFTSYRDPIQSMSAFASFGGWDGDVNMPGPSSSANDNSSTSLEDLFGDQFSGLIPMSDDFVAGESKASPSVSSHGHSKDGCPKTKEDVERLIASGPKGTFGESPVIGEETSSGTKQPNQSGCSYNSVFHQTLENTETSQPGPCDNFNIDELCLEMQRKAKCSHSAGTGVH